MSEAAKNFELYMPHDRFQTYLLEFEQTVAAVAVSNGLLGKRYLTPIRLGRLAKTGFGAKVGTVFESDVPFVIEYYGLPKKSTALCTEIEWVKQQLQGRQVKSIECLVLHFASIRIEHVARLNRDLVSEFPAFKKEILDARGFNHKF